VSVHSVQREVDDLVLQLKGLVHVRALLETRGAPDEELDAHSDEIARIRAELAARVSGGSMGTAARPPRSSPRRPPLTSAAA
jgi:hypothetical protein